MRATGYSQSFPAVLFGRLGLLMSLCLLGGCQSSATDDSIITPPAQFVTPMASAAEVESLGAAFGRQATQNTSIRRTFSTLERLQIRHAVIHVPQ